MPSFFDATMARGTLCRCCVLAVTACMLCVSALAQSSRLSTIYSFASAGSEPLYPNGVILGSGGVLYGQTQFGGTPSSCAYPQTCGMIFALTPPVSSPGPWTESTLYNFTGESGDGAIPYAGLVAGKKGILYGTTVAGGASGEGTIYQLTPPAGTGLPWTETVLYSFAGGVDGSEPNARLAVSSTGVLYGTTVSGGKDGYGTVFKLTQSRGLWKKTTLHSFTAQNGDGSGPYGALSLTTKGVLYGTTLLGGTVSETCGSGCGVVFELQPPKLAGHPWKETILYSFGGGTDSSQPYDGVFLGSDGSLYGTTYAGGYGTGTVFQLSPPAAAGNPWTEVVVHAFQPSGDGAYPVGGLVAGPDGTLYGTTTAGGTTGSGTIFSLTPPANVADPWIEKVLYSFTGGADGSSPSGLALSTAGYLFGTTSYDGASGKGTIFKLKP